MNKIFVVGDLHGYLEIIQRCNRFVDTQDIIISVGDFGVNKSLRQEWDQLYPNVKCPVFFIDGNHEDFSIIDQWPKNKITEVGNNLFYVPRGYVTIMMGKRIGFLGGAESVDYTWRTKGVDWFPQERITQDDVDRLIKNAGEEPLDILITHCPPTFAINATFPKINLQSWSLPADWVDVSAQMVEQAYVILYPERLICGHMHKSVTYENIRILDINEVMEI